MRSKGVVLSISRNQQIVGTPVNDKNNEKHCRFDQPNIRSHSPRKEKRQKAISNAKAETCEWREGDVEGRIFIPTFTFPFFWPLQRVAAQCPSIRDDEGRHGNDARNGKKKVVCCRCFRDRRR